VGSKTLQQVHVIQGLSAGLLDYVDLTLYLLHHFMTSVRSLYACFDALPTYIHVSIDMLPFMLAVGSSIVAAHLYPAPSFFPPTRSHVRCHDGLDKPGGILTELSLCYSIVYSMMVHSA